ncbi:hypothetical protein LTR97_005987 [Elasticomyces elasticus]|uniref:Uncharacterized protein n=1 Tax=Elasticomyces elasticus TaxID=574655 RepID=A0AAN7W796_9PEZI|nr:hypothetical protein LTR97_005987 [Elasticomyces elasticus]
MLTNPPPPPAIPGRFVVPRALSTLTKRRLYLACKRPAEAVEGRTCRWTTRYLLRRDFERVLSWRKSTVSKADVFDDEGKFHRRAADEDSTMVGFFYDTA